MHLKSLLPVFCFIMLMQNIVAMNVIVNGKNKDYAGERIVFNIYENLITSKEKIVATVIPDNLGEFSFQLNLSETEFVFALIMNQMIKLY